MKNLVVYDSLYGNTEMIAESIGEAIKGEVVCVDEVEVIPLEAFELLIVGSPVHGGRATPMIDQFLKNIPPNALKNIKVAAFDTRFAPEDHGIGIKILLHVIRFAAERIAKDLTKKSGLLVGKPEGFIVENKNGPLKNGELQRAKKWAMELEKWEPLQH